MYTTKEKLEKLRHSVHKMINKAKIIEQRRLSGIQRLDRFSLWKRILFYSKFNTIRSIIKGREMHRSGLVITSLSLIKTIKKIEKKLNDKSNN